MHSDSCLVVACWKPEPLVDASYPAEIEAVVLLAAAASLDILQLGLPCFAEALPGWVVQIQLLCYSIPVAAVALDAECQEIDLLALGLVQSWGADS